jgi:hypothetical protein
MQEYIEAAIFIALCPQGIPRTKSEIHKSTIASLGINVYGALDVALQRMADRGSIVRRGRTSAVVYLLLKRRPGEQPVP